MIFDKKFLLSKSHKYFISLLGVPTAPLSEPLYRLVFFFFPFVKVVFDVISALQFHLNSCFIPFFFNFLN